MSGFLGFGGSAGAPANPDYTYYPIGYGTDGDSVPITANTTANSEGSPWVSLGTAPADLTGIELHGVNVGNNSTARYFIDVSFDGGTTNHVPDLYYAPGTNAGRGDVFYIPMRVANGADIRLRMQSGTGATGSMRWAAQGIVGPAGHGFTNCTRLIAAGSSTRAGGTDFTARNTGSTTFDTVVDPTTQTYGAFIMAVGESATPLANIGRGQLKLATGAAGAETVIASMGVTGIAANNIFRANSRTILKSVPSGQRLSMQFLSFGLFAGTPDVVRPSLHAFY